MVRHIVNLFKISHSENINWLLIEAPSNLSLTLPPAVIEQPLINLLDNAAYHLNQHDYGKVSIRIEAHIETPETPLWILVGDNAGGMTAEQQANLFTPRITSKGEKGIGMGLYVSRNMLRSVGGELELLDTVRWLGSTFCIRLPMRLADMQADK